jgi:outer membrane protein TolC
MRALRRTADIAVQARSEVREGHSLLRSQYDVARRYRDEIVPLRKKMSDEMLLRYNGMLASVFELLADARSQIASVNAAIDAQRDFWIADSDLQFAIHGGSAIAVLPSATSLQPAATATVAAHAAAH